jgi:hypothetical protein
MTTQRTLSHSSPNFVSLKNPVENVGHSLPPEGTTCKTFFRLLNIEYIGNKKFSVALSWWNLNCIPNRVRMFAFKFFRAKPKNYSFCRQPGKILSVLPYDECCKPP